MIGRRRVDPAPALASFFLLALAAAAPRPAAAQGVEPPRVRSILIGGATNFPSSEPSLLPLPDEQLLERARTLLRGGQFAAADRTIKDLESRHPDDLDVILVRAEFMQRQEPAPAVARFLDERAKKSSVAKELRERPFRAGFWARFAADSYAAAGKIAEARARALEAWERSPEQASWARVRLEQWTDGGPEALAKDVAKLAAKAPERTDLALEASRLEAMSGRPRPAVERIVRAEAAAAKRGGRRRRGRAGGDAPRLAAVAAGAVAALARRGVGARRGFGAGRPRRRRLRHRPARARGVAPVRGSHERHRRTRRANGWRRRSAS